MSNDQNSRSQFAKRLLLLESSLGGTLRQMDQVKNQLRAECGRGGNIGFVEVLEGLGSVTVKAASLARLTGTQDLLCLEKWISLPTEDQVRLREGGLIVTEPKYSRASKSAITVVLDPLAIKYSTLVTLEATGNLRAELDARSAVILANLPH